MHRNDLSSVIGNFIALAESEIQTRCKVLEMETTGTVSVTAGAGSLPTGFLGARKVFWETSPDKQLTYVTPARLHAIKEASEADIPAFYTVEGGSIKVSSTLSGSLNVTYVSRFTPLSSTNTTTALLTNFPDLYLNGVLFYAAVWTEDAQKQATHRPLFDASIGRVNSNDFERRYPTGLAVRPA